MWNMEMILIAAISIVILGILWYVLYIKGYMLVSFKKAKIFIGTKSRGKNYSIAAFSSCNGYVKRVIRFKESREYSFEFHDGITNGNIYAEIWDAKKNRILTLDKNRQSGSINVNKKSRYYLVVKFDDADGKYEFVWN